MSDSVLKIQLKYLYKNRCAFCLYKFVEEGSQCAYILDPSTKCASQVCIEPLFLFGSPYVCQLDDCAELYIIPHDGYKEGKDSRVHKNTKRSATGPSYLSGTG